MDRGQGRECRAGSRVRPEGHLPQETRPVGTCHPLCTGSGAKRNALCKMTPDNGVDPLIGDPLCTARSASGSSVRGAQVQGPSGLVAQVAQPVPERGRLLACGALRTACQRDQRIHGPRWCPSPLFLIPDQRVPAHMPCAQFITCERSRLLTANADEVLPCLGLFHVSRVVCPDITSAGPSRRGTHLVRAAMRGRLIAPPDQV